jgi:hypothetical protein
MCRGCAGAGLEAPEQLPPSTPSCPAASMRAAQHSTHVSHSPCRHVMGVSIHAMSQHARRHPRRRPDESCTGHTSSLLWHLHCRGGQGMGHKGDCPGRPWPPSTSTATRPQPARHAPDTARTTHKHTQVTVAAGSTPHLPLPSIDGAAPAPAPASSTQTVTEGAGTNLGCPSGCGPSTALVPTALARGVLHMPSLQCPHTPALPWSLLARHTNTCHASSVLQQQPAEPASKAASSPGDGNPAASGPLTCTPGDTTWGLLEQGVDAPARAAPPDHQRLLRRGPGHHTGPHCWPKCHTSAEGAAKDRLPSAP